MTGGDEKELAVGNPLLHRQAMPVIDDDVLLSMAHKRGAFDQLCFIVAKSVIRE